MAHPAAPKQPSPTKAQIAASTISSISNRTPFSVYHALVQRLLSKAAPLAHALACKSNPSRQKVIEILLPTPAVNICSSRLPKQATGLADENILEGWL
jgi:hypothetical protein